MKNAWKLFGRSVIAANTFAGYLSGVVIVLCAAILVYEVAVRYWLGWATDWEIEFSIIALIIATFMSAGFTQITRGHVGIEVLDVILSERANKYRYLLSDFLSLLFCLFIAWKSWMLFHEAWLSGERSNSSWEPVLWPGYLSMGLGMTLLSLQLIVQLGDKHVHPIYEDAE